MGGFIALSDISKGSRLAIGVYSPHLANVWRSEADITGAGFLIIVAQMGPFILRTGVIQRGRGDRMRKKSCRRYQAINVAAGSGFCNVPKGQASSQIDTSKASARERRRFRTWVP